MAEFRIRSGEGTQSSVSEEAPPRPTSRFRSRRAGERDRWKARRVRRQYVKDRWRPLLVVVVVELGIAAVLIAYWASVGPTMLVGPTIGATVVLIPVSLLALTSRDGASSWRDGATGEELTSDSVPEHPDAPQGLGVSWTTSCSQDSATSTTSWLVPRACSRSRPSGPTSCGGSPTEGCAASAVGIRSSALRLERGRSASI